jgi:Tfp pilus assembly PilM family ATPase
MSVVIPRDQVTLDFDAVTGSSEEDEEEEMKISPSKKKQQ